MEKQTFLFVTKKDVPLIIEAKKKTDLIFLLQQIADTQQKILLMEQEIAKLQKKIDELVEQNPNKWPYTIGVKEHSIDIKKIREKLEESKNFLAELLEKSKKLQAGINPENTEEVVKEASSAIAKTITFFREKIQRVFAEISHHPTEEALDPLPYYGGIAQGIYSGYSNDLSYSQQFEQSVKPLIPENGSNKDEYDKVLEIAAKLEDIAKIYGVSNPLLVLIIATKQSLQSIQKLLESPLNHESALNSSVQRLKEIHELISTLGEGSRTLGFPEENPAYLWLDPNFPEGINTDLLKATARFDEKIKLVEKIGLRIPPEKREETILLLALAEALSDPKSPLSSNEGAGHPFLPIIDRQLNDIMKVNRSKQSATIREGSRGNILSGSVIST